MRTSDPLARLSAVVALAWLAGALPACALLTKAEPLEPRYFTPESTSAPVPDAARREPSGLELRLARVNAGSSIRDRLVYREGGHEVGYYEERRWTEKPEAYVRRALARALFERRAIAQVLAGPAPTLDVDVIAFEEVRGAGKAPHVARVELAFALHDERAVRLSDRVTVERPIAEARDDAAANATAQAVGEAMEAAVEAVAATIAQKLAVLAAPAARPVVSSAP